MPTASLQTLAPQFFFSLPGNIWKVRVDPVTGNLVLEVRQPQKLQAFFSVADPEAGTMLQPEIRIGEPWWTGLEDVCNGFLLVHGYEKNSQTGRHTGLTAISEESGKIAWQHPELIFKGLLDAEKLVAENLLGQLQEVKLTTGAIKPFAGTAAEAKARTREFELQRMEAFRFPVPYLPADQHFTLLREFIKEKTGYLAEETIEYLENEKGIFLSFYARNSSVMANFLLVCSLSGQVLLQVCLESKVTGLGTDTFFIFAEKLFFIQEKSGLAGYLL
ncbi:MAG TPA: DUF4905 domain-containing protein [Adhaeribacter sp.]|nr:DUF4905 domain-containing protein [Adhaeribacter sp.]